MPEMTFNKKHLDAALATVTAELTDLLKAESAELAKAAKDDAPAEESEGSSPPAKPADDGGDEASAAPPAEASAPPAEGSMPPAEGSAPPAEGSAPPEISAAAGAPEGSPQHEAGEIEPAMSVEQLQAEIMKQPPEYQKMLFLAAKAALMASMGGDQGAAPDASAAPPMAAPPAPPAGAPPMAMAEHAGKQLPNNPGNGGKMGKSEEALKVEALEKQLAEQSDELLKLVAVVDKMTTPVRKSIKGVSDLKFVSRTEGDKKSPAASLTKAEVTEKLKERIRDGKLSKSDKNLVSQYTMGIVDVNAIEHLLTGAK
jgi:hypothetical protein